MSECIKKIPPVNGKPLDLVLNDMRMGYASSILNSIQRISNPDICLTDEQQRWLKDRIGGLELLSKDKSKIGILHRKLDIMKLVQSMNLSCHHCLNADCDRRPDNCPVPDPKS